MKKIITLLITTLITLNVFSQITAPQKMSYQAIIRNSNNELVKDSPVMIKLSILENSITGISIYTETHSQYTNENGLLNIQIGGGQAINEEYKDINWGKSLFLKTEIDPLGVGLYTITSTSELLSVPVSNYSHISGALHGPAWDFVGAYTNITLNPDWLDLKGYSYITFIGTDKVMWTFTYSYTDFNNNSIQDENESPTTITLYGTVLSNVVTFKSQLIGNNEDTPEFIGTKTGNTITFTSYGGEVFKLIKE